MRRHREQRAQLTGALSGLLAAIVLAAARRSGATLLPVDSEHNAIFQALDLRDPAKVEKIVLTASGGPCRTMDAAEMRAVTPEVLGAARERGLDAVALARELGITRQACRAAARRLGQPFPDGRAEHAARRLNADRALLGPLRAVLVAAGDGHAGGRDPAGGGAG